MLDLRMMEYQFEDGDKLSEIVTEDYIKYAREYCKDSCFEVARGIWQDLWKQSTLSSVVTFKNGLAFMDGGISVWNELTQAYETYTHHSVVLLGDCVVDVLHSDRLIATVEYVGKLKEDNPKLRIDGAVSGYWYNSAGHEVQVTVERLLSGNWD